jgi:hypothetical protein
MRHYQPAPDEGCIRAAPATLLGYCFSSRALVRQPTGFECCIPIQQVGHPDHATLFELVKLGGPRLNRRTTLLAGLQTCE